MPIVINEPYVRFELQYGRYLTVIEGAEMALLEEKYREHTVEILSNLKKYGLTKREKMLPFTISMLASIFAYNELYESCVSQDELRDLSTPDARKMDLFYRGKLIHMRQAFFPKEDWNKLYETWGDGLFEAAIKHYSCFISYSAKNQRFVDRLYRDLKRKGVRCWCAPHDLAISKKILDEVHAAIEARDKVLLVLSKEAIESDWVEDEVTAAYEQERRRKKVVLFPIRLDDAVMTTTEAWAAKVRARYIGDFRRWKDVTSYKRNLTRVVRDLLIEQ